MRIPQEELERLKRETDLAVLVRNAGVELKPHGSDLIGQCIFHDDHTPSLVITPSKNLFHCFGCGAKGSVVDWVMRTQDVSFRHAVELLRAGQPLAADRVKTAPQLPCPLDEEKEGPELLDQVIAYYHQVLCEGGEGREYLKGRGLNDDELIRTFRIGFVNRTLGLRLPHNNRKAGALLRGRLQELGVLRETGHEALRGCVVFPVVDEGGRVVEVYGRRVERSKSKIRHLYLPGPHAGIFNGAGVMGGDDVILCESIIDACTFWVAGHRNVTSAFGTNGITPALRALLMQKRRVFIAFDRDDAGDEAAKKLAVALISKGVEVFRVLFPRGMDANEYALKVKPAEKALDLVLKRAEWMGMGPPRLPAPAMIGEGVAELAGDDVVKAAKEEAAPAASSAPADPGVEVEPPAALAPLEAPTAPKPLPLAAKDDAPIPSPPYEIEGDEVRFSFGARRYRVRGLAKNLAPEVLKVNLLAAAGGERFHVDTLDLYSAKARAIFIRTAATELGQEQSTLKREIGQVLLALEQLQTRMLDEVLAPKDKRPEMTEQERQEALAFLEAPELLPRILEAFEAIGVVGEETNKLVGYLAAVSRKLKKPLAVMVQSSSAAGKSSLMDAVLSFVPDEEKVAYSAMTGQSLFYMEDGDLRHKVLAIAEEEGAERASYALKVLQSEGRLRIASTGKDPQTGRHVTSEYEVEGPVAIFSTTTAIDVDEELMNRCLVLTVDESAAQTEIIHKHQRDRRTAAGLERDLKRDALLKLHQNAQRLLLPLPIVNPYAPKLTFPSHQTRTRRDHQKYLDLIDVIALLHQHQRPLKQAHTAGGVVEYVEVQLADIALANELAHQVLGRSLDELAPQTQKVLFVLEEKVRERMTAEGLPREEVRFIRKAAREWTGLSATQLHVQLGRLVELEYVAVVKRKGARTLEYELLWDGEGKDGRPHLPGLVDPDALAREYGAANSVGAAANSQLIRPEFGANSGGIRSAAAVEKPSVDSGLRPMAAPTTGNALRRGPKNGRRTVAVHAHANGALPLAETC